MNEKYSIKWVPKLGEDYYLVDEDGNTSSYIMGNWGYQYAMIYIGNCFKTEREAIDSTDKILKLFEAVKKSGFANREAKK